METGVKLECSLLVYVYDTIVKNAYFSSFLDAFHCDGEKRWYYCMWTHDGHITVSTAIWPCKLIDQTENKTFWLDIKMLLFKGIN